LNIIRSSIMSNQSNQVFKILFKVCKENNLQLVLDKCDFDFNTKYNLFTDSYQKGFIVRNLFCHLPTFMRYEEYVMKCRSDTKLVVLFIDTHGFRVIFKDEWLGCYFRQHNYETMVEKFIKNILKQDIGDLRECGICFEKIKHSLVCEKCLNPICKECALKINKCPFCRHDFGDFKVQVSYQRV